MATITPTRSATHEATIARAASDNLDSQPGIPYRAMATLVGRALEQAQLITSPLARAVALDGRIAADPHLRRATRLLAQLHGELSAELDALHAHTQTPAMSATLTGMPVES
jgi:hypothetical protein